MPCRPPHRVDRRRQSTQSQGARHRRLHRRPAGARHAAGGAARRPRHGRRRRPAHGRWLHRGPRHLARRHLRRCPSCVGASGRRLQPGTVTIAPSWPATCSFSDRLRVTLQQPPPTAVPRARRSTRPSPASPTPSARDAVGVLLTGMGRDGALGLQAHARPRRVHHRSGRGDQRGLRHAGRRAWPSTRSTASSRSPTIAPALRQLRAVRRRGGRVMNRSPSPTREFAALRELPARRGRARLRRQPRRDSLAYSVAERMRARGRATSPSYLALARPADRRRRAAGAARRGDHPGDALLPEPAADPRAAPARAARAAAAGGRPRPAAAHLERRLLHRRGALHDRDAAARAAAGARRAGTSRWSPPTSRPRALAAAGAARYAERAFVMTDAARPAAVLRPRRRRRQLRGASDEIRDARRVPAPQPRHRAAAVRARRARPRALPQRHDLLRPRDDARADAARCTTACATAATCSSVTPRRCGRSATTSRLVPLGDAFVYRAARRRRRAPRGACPTAAPEDEPRPTERRPPAPQRGPSTGWPRWSRGSPCRHPRPSHRRRRRATRWSPCGPLSQRGSTPRPRTSRPSVPRPTPLRAEAYYLRGLALATSARRRRAGRAAQGGLPRPAATGSRTSCSPASLDRLGDRARPPRAPTGRPPSTLGARPVDAAAARARRP